MGLRAAVFTRRRLVSAIAGVLPLRCASLYNNPDYYGNQHHEEYADDDGLQRIVLEDMKYWRRGMS
jgi:hypothetical protein